MTSVLGKWVESVTIERFNIEQGENGDGHEKIGTTEKGEGGVRTEQQQALRYSPYHVQ